MGRKERARYDNNEKVKEILALDNPTPEQIKFVRDAFSGVGSLTTSGFNNGQFFTPLEITYFVTQMMGIKKGSVLEPSCGGGAFLRVLPDECDVYGSELMHDAFRVSDLCYPDTTIRQGDTLKMDWGRKFDYVIGNPPYGLKMPEWKSDFAKNAKLRPITNNRTNTKQRATTIDDMINPEISIPFAFGVSFLNAFIEIIKAGIPTIKPEIKCIKQAIPPKLLVFFEILPFFHLLLFIVFMSSLLPHSP